MKMQMRYFHCPVCHTIMTAPKLKNFKKEKYKGADIEKICIVQFVKKNNVSY